MPTLAITTKPGKKYRSLKRPRVYEALRRQGMSKQSAARISNAQAHKALTLDQLEAFVLSPHYDPDTAAAIALRVPALPSLKGEQIAPGVTRIHGNLCNVHGRYGRCPGAPATAPKPKKGRAPRKPRQTPAQRAAARDAEHAKNRSATLTAQGYSASDQASLEALRSGGQPGSVSPALIDQGVVEQAQDGSYRLSSSGRALMHAAGQGDAGRARDTVSGARDRLSARRQRQEAARKRQQDAAGKRASAQVDRELRKREREQAQAKRQAARAKPGKAGGGKAPARRASSPIRTPRKRGAFHFSGGPSGSGGAPKPKKPIAPKSERPAKPQIAPALTTAAQSLSDGKQLSDADTLALIRNGLAHLVKGDLVLTAAGRRATMKEAPAHTGVMVALYPDPAAAKQIAAQADVTEPIDQLHLTLAFLGDSTEMPLSSNKAKLIAAIKQWAMEKGTPLNGAMNGIGRFFHSEDDDTNAVYVSPDVPGLPELRQSLIEWIERSGFDYAQNHGFTPHITVAYVPLDAPTPPIRVETPITFDHVTLAWGDERYDYPLGMAAQKDFSFRVFKDARGQMRWVAQSSTAYQDRDQEIVSTKALEDDCRFADKHQAYGPLRWWHCPGLDLGDCDFNAMHGRVLIESGTFRSPAIAQKVARAADRLEISLGFLHLPTEPDAGGVFHHIRRFERSLVPRGKASNRFTAFRVKETPMFDATKIAALKTLGFSDTDITSLQTQAEATEKAADDQNVAFKADEPATDYPDVVINGITYKAVPPALTPPAEAEKDDGEGDMEVMAEDAAEPDTEADAGGLTLSPEDLDAIGQAVGAALQGVATQIMGALDLEKKVAGHVQGLMAPFQAQKDATDAERAEQIAQLQTSLKATQDKLDELLGLQPAVTPRASAAPASALNPFNPADNALLATIKDQVPADQQPFVNGFEDLKIKLFGS